MQDTAQQQLQTLQVAHSIYSKNKVEINIKTLDAIKIALPVLPDKISQIFNNLTPEEIEKRYREKLVQYIRNHNKKLQNASTEYIESIISSQPKTFDRQEMEALYRQCNKDHNLDCIMEYLQKFETYKIKTYLTLDELGESFELIEKSAVQKLNDLLKENIAQNQKNCQMFCDFIEKEFELYTKDTKSFAEIINNRNEYLINPSEDNLQNLYDACYPVQDTYYTQIPNHQQYYLTQQKYSNSDSSQSLS